MSSSSSSSNNAVGAGAASSSQDEEHENSSTKNNDTAILVDEEIHTYGNKEALDRAMAGSKTWTVEERDKYMDELAENPLFMSRISDTDAASHRIVQALHNAEYDEIDTPSTLAQESKTKGNDAFVKGPEWYPNAIRHYNEALDHAEKARKMAISVLETAAAETSASSTSSSSTSNTTTRPVSSKQKKKAITEKKDMTRLASQIHANLAAIYLHRKKYISVLNSCEASLRLWPDNAKAAFRAARACLALGYATRALDFCELGKTADPVNEQQFDPVVKEANEIVQRQERMAAATAKELAVAKQKLDQVRVACKGRGIRIGPPIFSGMRRRTHAQPYVDEEGCLHWPVMVLYPQFSETDYLEDVPENATMTDILDHLMPTTAAGNSSSSSSPPWDLSGEYAKRENVEIFFKSNPCKSIAYEQAWTLKMEGETPQESFATSRFIRIPFEAPLLLPLMQVEYVVADIPVFYVIAKTSKLYADLKEKSGGAFVTLRMPDFDSMQQQQQQQGGASIKSGSSSTSPSKKR